MPHRIRITAGAIAALASSAVAQSFSYPDFTNSAGLSFNGNAALSGNVLRVTPSVASQRGTVWRTLPVDVAAGFDTTFRFQIALPTGTGADGMALVIHNDPRGVTALGDQGSSMGYGAEPTQPVGLALSNSLAIEIDTYAIANPWGDPNGNHISVHTNGTSENNAYESYSIGIASPSANLSDGLVHTLRVRYDGALLQVFLDNASTPAISSAYNFATGGTWLAGGNSGGLGLLGGTSAYVGFSAATGGATETHDVLSWTWGTLLPVSYCTAGTSSHGCTPTIAANANPSATLATPCTLSITGLDGQKNGIVFYALTQFVQPWAVGSSSLLCVKPPTQRTTSQNAGGTLLQCDGAFALDWNAFQQANPSALGNPWSVGRDVFCQGWYRDPPAPKTTNLSDALWMTYLP